MMPRLVGSGHVKFTSVACGAGHTLALTANGRVFLSAGARSVLLDTGTDSIAMFPDWWMRFGAWE